ncbi:MAG TPA: hypothetical protein VIJ20_03170 [Solirubrobacteraceae bacterium]
MFRSSLNRVLNWAEQALAPSDEESIAAEKQLAAPHPHRRELRWERERRPGSVPHRPAHCISPVVRRSARARPRQDSAR